MTKEEKEIMRRNLVASRANHLESLIRLSKTMWQDECMNRD